MKICISCISDNKETEVDRRFGRCPYYAIYDDSTKEINFVKNVGAVSAHGAGIQAAQQVVDEGVSKVITGNCGPNACRVLKGANIEIYKMSGTTLINQIKDLQDNKLNIIDVPGPAHMGGNF